MDVLFLQINVFKYLGRPTQLHFRDVPWVNFCFRTAECIQMSALKWQTSPQLSKQYNQPHLMGFYCRTVPQLSKHYPPSNSIKFTHPPTQADTAGSISIWIATTFDVLVRYSWCSGCEKTQWLWDLKEKPAHGSSYAVWYPTSIYGAQCISGVIL